MQFCCWLKYDFLSSLSNLDNKMEVNLQYELADLFHTVATMH
jgi:hypothetical protein